VGRSEVLAACFVCLATIAGSGCDQRSSDGASPHQPQGRRPLATQPAAKQEDEAIAWWKGYVEDLRRRPRVMEEDHCEGCDPNVPHLFLVDRELARLAREDVEPRERAAPLLVCGVPDKSNRFTDCVAIRTGETTADYVTEGSGVIIAEREVLTAAHVWDAAKGKSKPRVVVADNARSNESNRIFEVVGQPRRHPQADMVILKLDRPVPPELYVKKQVVAASTISKATRLVIAGFGTTGSEASGTRRVVNVHVAEAPCDESGGVDYGCRSPFEFVAAEPIESGAWCDSCNIDSGGPAYVETSPGTWGIVGIVKGAIPRAKREKMVPPCQRTGNCGCGSIYTYAIEHKSIP